MALLRRALPLLCLAGLLVPAAPASARSACTGATAMPDSANVNVVKSVTLCLLNRERAQHGLRPLHENRQLERAAHRHSGDMVAHKVFSHSSSNGGAFDGRIRGAGYLRRASSWMVGENIAFGSGPLASARAIVNEWMHSPGHRANILNGAFHDIGVGIVYGTPAHGGGQGATYTTDFGRRG
jgi:uncharacterized protein YkwD